VVKQRHPCARALRIGQQGRDLRRLERRALMGWMRRHEEQHGATNRAIAGPVDPRQLVHGKGVSADARVFHGIRAGDLLIERLCTRGVQLSGARSRARVELGEECGGMINPEAGLHQPISMGGPAGLHTGFQFGHCALVQQNSHVAIGSGHQGRGQLAAPRGRSPSQPINQSRIRSYVQVGVPVCDDGSRCPRRSSDLSQLARVVSRRRTDYRGGARGQRCCRLEEDLQTRLRSFPSPPDTQQHAGRAKVSIDVILGPSFDLVVAHRLDPRQHPRQRDTRIARRGDALLHRAEVEQLNSLDRMPSLSTAKRSA
jgi:hypothetical protein